MLISIKMSAENEIRIEMTIANQCTGERNSDENVQADRIIFSICIYFLPQK